MGKQKKEWDNETGLAETSPNIDRTNKLNVYDDW